MKLGRIMGVGLSAALAAGALTTAPSPNTPRAEAAVVAPVIAEVKAPSIAWPKRSFSDWHTKTVPLGTTLTLKVKATGGSLKYQWYMVDTKDRKVSGKSARTSALKIKLTSKTRGKAYYAVVRNSKGKVRSGYYQLLEKRGKVASVKAGQAGRVGKYRVASLGSHYVDRNGNILARGMAIVQNITKSKAKPGSTLRFSYRAPNGKLYPAKTSEIYRWTGAKAISLKPGTYTLVDYLDTGEIPRTAKGGHWVVWSKSEPKHKMVLAVRQR